MTSSTCEADVKTEVLEDKTVSLNSDANENYTSAQLGKKRTRRKRLKLEDFDDPDYEDYSFETPVKCEYNSKVTLCRVLENVYSTVGI